MKMKLKELMNSDSGVTWIGPAIDHGDFPFHFLLKLQYTEYWGDAEMLKTMGKYMVEILAVSTVAAKDKLADAARSMSMTLEEFKALPSDAQHEMLADYGIAARLYSGNGNNLRTVLRAARKELEIVDFLFGFKMDQAQNAMGATGWDWIKGDITGPRVKS